MAPMGLALFQSGRCLEKTKPAVEPKAQGEKGGIASREGRLSPYPGFPRIPVPPRPNPAGHLLPDGLGGFSLHPHRKTTKIPSDIMNKQKQLFV